MVYAMREGTEEPCLVHERWVEGLFAQDRWLEWLSDAGFRPRAVAWDNEDAPLGSTLFLGLR